MASDYEMLLTAICSFTFTFTTTNDGQENERPMDAWKQNRPKSDDLRLKPSENDTKFDQT